MSIVRSERLKWRSPFEILLDPPLTKGEALPKVLLFNKEGLGGIFRLTGRIERSVWLSPVETPLGPPLVKGGGYEVMIA